MSVAAASIGGGRRPRAPERKMAREADAVAPDGAGARHGARLLRSADALHGADELQPPFRPAALCARLHLRALCQPVLQSAVHQRDVDHGAALAAVVAVHRRCSATASRSSSGSSRRGGGSCSSGWRSARCSISEIAIIFGWWMFFPRNGLLSYALLSAGLIDGQDQPHVYRVRGFRRPRLCDAALSASSFCCRSSTASTSGCSRLQRRSRRAARHDIPRSAAAADLDRHRSSPSRSPSSGRWGPMRRRRRSGRTRCGRWAS